MYVYRCVQVPELIQIGKKDPHSAATKAYEDLINQYAQEGWEYVSGDFIESFYKQGCLAAIPIIGAFFRKDEQIRVKMIVLRKPA